MWKLRDIVVAVILSAVCGAIYMGWDYLSAPLFTTTVSPVVAGLVNGVWWIAAGLVAYIIRRPGAAFFAGTVSAIFEVSFGSPYGVGAIISGLLQGGGTEVGLLLGRWKNYRVAMMMLAGAVGGIGNSLQWLFQYGGDKYSMGVIVGYILTTMLSGAVLAGLVPKLIGDALNRAGVVRNFELGKQSRSQEA